MLYFYVSQVSSLLPRHTSAPGARRRGKSLRTSRRHQQELNWAPTPTNSRSQNLMTKSGILWEEKIPVPPTKNSEERRSGSLQVSPLKQPPPWCSPRPTPSLAQAWELSCWPLPHLRHPRGLEDPPTSQTSGPPMVQRGRADTTWNDTTCMSWWHGETSFIVTSQNSEGDFETYTLTSMHK
jgi:hypothetical protein